MILTSPSVSLAYDIVWSDIWGDMVKMIRGEQWTDRDQMFLYLKIWHSDLPLIFDLKDLLDKHTIFLSVAWGLWNATVRSWLDFAHLKAENHAKNSVLESINMAFNDCSLLIDK